MRFSEFEMIMAEQGITSLADIARALDTTPQAVSNWKARDQVPYRTVAEVNNRFTNKTSNYQNVISPVVENNDIISFSDIFLTLAEQLKVIVLFPIVIGFITFTNVKFFQKATFASTAKILLPEVQKGPAGGGMAGLASQFGVNIPQGGPIDLSSPALFPELVNSYIFAERILSKKFYKNEFKKSLSLLSILTHGVDPALVGRDTLILRAREKLEKMIRFSSEGSFSLLTVFADEAKLARDINVAVLDELQILNKSFKSQNVSDRIDFINNRIISAKTDLEKYEQELKVFREQNQQVISPSLQLIQERLSRDMEIQKGIYLTLKQQLELANIEKIQSESVLQILDAPQVPLSGKGKNARLSVIISIIFGIGFGVLVAFIRSFITNNDVKEKRKFRRIRNFINKKSKDIFYDKRFTGVIGLMLLMASPMYFGHKSDNPVFFNMYSSKLMLVNSLYLFVMVVCIILFFRSPQQKNQYNK